MEAKVSVHSNDEEKQMHKRSSVRIQSDETDEAIKRIKNDTVATTDSNCEDFNRQKSHEEIIGTNLTIHRMPTEVFHFIIYWQ